MIFFLLVFILAFTVKTFSFYILNNRKSFSNAVIDSSWYIPYILLQQFLLFSFWKFYLSDLDFYFQALLIGVIFSLCHIVLFRTLKMFDALIIFVPSFFGGILFAILYLTHNDGFLLSFSVHTLFHICLDLFYYSTGRGPIQRLK